MCALLAQERLGFCKCCSLIRGDDSELTIALIVYSFLPVRHYTCRLSIVKAQLPALRICELIWASKRVPVDDVRVSNVPRVEHA